VPSVSSLDCGPNGAGNTTVLNCLTGFLLKQRAGKNFTVLLLEKKNQHNQSAGETFPAKQIFYLPLLSFVALSNKMFWWFAFSESGWAYPDLSKISNIV